jgi:hypothetical protein
MNSIAARVRPFRMTYVTDGTEGPVNAPALILAPADTSNVGFCVDYLER